MPMAGHLNGLHTRRWVRIRENTRCEWDPELAALDLEYWSDPIACENRAFPSYAELAEDWGWSKSRVGRFVKEWRDGSGTTVGRERDAGGTADQGAKVDTKRERDAGGTTVGRERDAGGTAPKVVARERLPSARLPSAEVSPSETHGGSALREDFHVAAMFWGHEVLRAQGRKVSNGPGWDTVLGKKLRSTIKRDGIDEVLDAFRWVAHGKRDHAVFLRDRESDMETVIGTGRSVGKVARYAKLWREHGETPEPKGKKQAKTQEKKGALHRAVARTLQNQEPSC